ncbi:HU family DNA-binding protein [Streptomyces boncukensis]|uniref:HU family DNA-binding protein n=1 Tax=Streptomyces boncukensis TaxID=2711219 RepID=A0A6G4WX06_9ACTN|nr:HU family DNA-binding protein [Streptomyces boncukensis]NGO69160.1 HU family DNA-binding protein [Streptomyces boncukensis]
MTTHVQPKTDLNKGELADALAAELGISRRQARLAVEGVFDLIARAVSAGHTVTISNFGSWRPEEKPARAARNPFTGERVQVPARGGMRWRTSPRLREHLRDGTAATIRKHPKGTLRAGGDVA